jgi:osmotically-inducible protein OsmY
MSRTRRHAPAPRTLRAALLAALGLWLFCAGGCAMLPFAIATTASLAMPQNASLAMSGVKGVYNTAYLASDERDMNTIVRDNMLSLKAQSAMLTANGSSDVQVRAYNGEIFAVGVVDTEADRNRVIQAMQNVKGVGAIKGYIRLRDSEKPVNRLADSSLENQARLAMARHLLHKNAGVEIQAVDGQLCLMGVVGTHAEALDIIQYVETVTGKPALSLLAIRDEYATGHTQTNRLYLLKPGEDTPRGITLQDDPNPLPSAPVRLAQDEGATAGNSYRAPVRLAPAMRTAPARLAPVALAPAANKARAHVQQKLTALARQEANPLARAELLTLAPQVAQDRDLSISDRLSVAADAATQQQSKAKIQALLALY